ncbi:MCE family protein [Nocardioides sp.]|uniref:MCE family protein n=1 Tax=Nocardioides sp. TaxID=35761 RepID=UPI0035182B4B
MISRRTKLQVLAFVVLASVGIVYVGGKYAGLDRLFGPTSYTVRMQLADSGGIFTNAEVTYRGVTVGRVGTLTPTADGVTVDLEIDKDAEPIPADGVQAEVRNLSLIGEPYVDLTPATAQGPFLAEGSVIPVERTRTPVAPAALLTSVNGLLDSIPRGSVTTVLRELDAAFSGTGPDLERLLDSTADVVATAQDVLPQTLRLIEDGATVLRTQNDGADSIRSFSRDLRLLAGQLASSDDDLRRLIRTAPALSTQAVALLQESGPGLSRLVADLLTTGRLLEPRDAALRQLLVTYPGLARAAYSAIPGDGSVKFGLVLNVFDPPSCTKGYEGTKRRPGSATSDVPVNDQATCAERRGSPIVVRGSQNAPRAGVPDAARPGGLGTVRPLGEGRTRGADVAAPAVATLPVSPEVLAQLAALLRQPPTTFVSDPLQVLLQGGP